VSKLAEQINEITARYKARLEDGLPSPRWIFGPLTMAQMHAEIIAVIRGSTASASVGDDVLGINYCNEDNARRAKQFAENISKLDGVKIIDDDEEGDVS